jgi:hypothetical protein
MISHCGFHAHISNDNNVEHLLYAYWAHKFSCKVIVEVFYPNLKLIWCLSMFVFLYQNARDWVFIKKRHLFGSQFGRVKSQDQTETSVWPLVKAFWLCHKVAGGITWQEHMQERKKETGPRKTALCNNSFSQFSKT